MVKTTGNERTHITVMLTVAINDWILSPYVILERKTIPKEQLPSDIFGAQEKDWWIEELVIDWLKVVWGRQSEALLKKRGMLILYSFHGHTTDKVKK